MNIEIRVPASGGEYMESVIVVEWCVAPGAAVQAGQILLVVETAKTSIDIEAPADGVMGDIVATQGEEVAIGGLLGLLQASQTALPVAGVEAGQPALSSVAAVSAVVAAPPVVEVSPSAAISPAAASVQVVAVAAGSPAAKSGDERRPVSPAARRLARQAGVDLSTIAPSSPSGRIKRRDVQDVRAGTDVSSAVPLFLQRRGARDGTPIVFIHGFGADMLGWTPLLASLGKTHPVVMVDLPSHGRSPRFPVQDVQGLADAVLAALQRESLHKVHLVGHSLGGAVAINLAGSAHLAVNSLALLAPAGLGPEVDGAFLQGFARASEVGSLAPWLRALVADPRGIDDGFVELAMQARADAALRQAQQEMAGALFPDGTQRAILRDALDSLDLPARIIWGMQDRIIPWRHALGLSGRVGLHLLPDVGHIPQFEAPQRVAVLIDELVRSAN